MVVNVFLFDDFEVMDAFGPVQVFGCTPEHFYIRFISMRGGLINGKQGMKVWTEPLNPLEIEDIFLIPGGKGVKSFLHTEGEKSQQLLKQAVEESSFCMMVQNASAMLARTGLLFHRQVADYAYDETGSGCLQWESIMSMVKTGSQTENIIPAVQQWRQ